MVFQNPNIELGVIPKGRTAFFLSKMLGAVTASRVMYSQEDITAVQAQQLGIVDKVVPLEDIDRVTQEIARSYARLPSGYAVGIKKLLNFNLKELDHYLEFETNLLRKQVQSCYQHNFGKQDETL